MGPRTNVAAGTITCNFDGVSKNRTAIGSDCFVGSNTTLVAPVSLGDGSLIAAGSVVTQVCTLLPQGQGSSVLRSTSLLQALACSAAVSCWCTASQQEVAEERALDVHGAVQRQMDYVICDL